MKRNSALSLFILGVATVLALAGCGGSSHTYVVTPSSSLAAGVYVTIVSPVPLPQGMLDQMKKGLTFVERAQGPEICTYSKEIQGVKGQYASFNGKTLTVKVNGSSPLISAVCSGLQKHAFNPTDFGASPKPKKRTQHTFSRIGPILMTSAQLKAESRILETPIYWAGPLKGYRYEFTRTSKGFLYVRYLPRALRAGAPGANFLIVSTYPIVGAYHSLKKASHGRAIAGKHGSILLVNASYRKSVLMAWPGVDYQVEVYNPKPVISATIAESGQVEPVR